MNRWVVRLAACLAATLCLAHHLGVSEAHELAALHVALSPDELNASTTIRFGFEVRTDTGAIPAALTNLSFLLPKGMNIATSTLGLATCTVATLSEDGPEACSRNAEVGFGTGFLAVPLGVEPVEERVALTAFAGPPKRGNIVILFYVNGESPISAQTIFSGELLSDSGVFGGQLNTALPLVPTVPDGADVSVLRFSSTIGPYRLLYRRRVSGKTVPYHPRGLNVPSRCPRGGFPFAAELQFQDGSTVTARHAVPCPERSRKPGAI
jgi:hypothetical protein